MGPYVIATRLLYYLASTTQFLIWEQDKVLKIQGAESEAKDF